MFKQYRLIVALLIIGLIGGGYATTVDASASFGGSTSDNGTQMEQKQDSKDSYEQRWESFLHKFFGQWQNQPTQKEKVEKENPKEQEVEKQPETENKPEVEQPNVEESPKDVEEQSSNNSEASALKPFEQRVVDLTNVEREKHGLAPLQVDLELSKVSRDKSQDILDNNYFAHNSPVYGSPFDMMSDYGIDYRAAGENIAKGQDSPEEVVNAWMNSQGHRENILSGNFTHIGVGYVEEGNVWTQQFIGR